MVSFAELRAAQPQSYHRAARAWARFVEVIGQQGDVLADRDRQLEDAWTGAAGVAAGSRLGTLGVDFAEHSTLAGTIPGILADHADQLANAQAAVERVLAALVETPIHVDSRGSVHLAPLSPAVAPAWLQLARRAQELIDAAVALATAADVSTATRIRSAMPPRSDMPVPVDQVSGDPVAVAGWWRSLTPAQREWLLVTRAAWIGNLDGIPTADRDRANRRVLAVEKVLLRERADADKLGGIEAIERRLQDAGPGKQRAYLLGFDTAGRGQVIVAMGNPDTADNVVTCVPGTGARLGTIGGDLARADAIVDSARVADPAESTVAIAWVGYDAPQDVINTDLGHFGEDATSDRYALAARDRLDRFQEGLRVTQQGERSHNTVVGHSYGSTVVGYTARDRGLDADEVIFLGSPGVGVAHARDLGIPADHVWSTTARNDPIQYGYDVGDLIRAGLGLDPQVDLIHGANPSSREFGGQVFASDPGDPLVRWEWDRGPFGIPAPEPRFSANAHSQYWEPGSASLVNIGHIVVGNRPVTD